MSAGEGNIIDTKLATIRSWWAGRRARPQDHGADGDSRTVALALTIDGREWKAAANLEAGRGRLIGQRPSGTELSHNSALHRTLGRVRN